MTNHGLLRRLLIVGGIVGSLPAAAQNPALQLSATSLAFSAVANGNKPPLQVITVTSVDSTAINFALLVDSGAPGTPAPAWLNVTPLLATTPVQIRVVVDPAGLAAGSYSGRIQLTDRQGRTLGVIIPVSFQVTSGAAQFDVTPSAVFMSGSPASGNLQQGILVRSLGSGPIAPVTASVLSGFSGLSAVADPCDTICIVRLNAAIATLPAGPHNGVVRITTAIGSKDVPVSVFVADHGPYDQLSTSALSFEAVQVSGVMDSRTVLLLNTGDMPSTWTADVPEGAQWLAVSPASGVIAPGKSTALTVSLNLGNQSPAVYSGMVRISSDPGAATLYLPVVLRVAINGTPPVPLLSVAGAVLSAQAGAADSVQQQVMLAAAASTPVNFQASPQGQSWLSVVPSRGQASATPTPLTVSAAPINQAQGFYSGLINVGFGTSSVRTLHVGFGVTAASPACQPQFSFLTEIGIPDNFAVPTGAPQPLEVVLNDDCGNPVANGLVTATFSNGDPGMDLVNIGNGHYAQTWAPVNSSASLPGGNAVVGFQGFAPSLKPAFTEVAGMVMKDSFPAIATGGVLNNLGAQVGGPLAPGAVAQIFGSALAAGTASGTVANGRLSTSVGGVSVKIGGLDAPIFYASSGQINIQIPSELQPNRQYQVIVNNNGVYSKPEPINTTPVQPGLAAFPDGKVIAQDVNFNLINVQNPAHPGDIIILYLTGMGATNPPVPTGVLAPASPLAVTAVQPQVTIDGAPAEVTFAGLSPGGVGLYQIDVRVPNSARAADLSLTVSQNGVSSNTAVLPVR